MSRVKAQALPRHPVVRHPASSALGLTLYSISAVSQPAKDIVGTWTIAAAEAFGPNPKRLLGSSSTDRRIFDIMTVTEEKFVPLTISLTSFVKDGSDRDFRQLIYALTRLQNQMAHHIQLFGAYSGGIFNRSAPHRRRVVARRQLAQSGYPSGIVRLLIEGNS